MFKFRPHHLLCNLFFQGKGYNAKFVENFSLINQALLIAPELKQLQIVNGIDDICRQCPKNKAGKCEDDFTVAVLDSSYFTLLQLSVGEVLSLNEVKTKVRKFLSRDKFSTVCSQCPWKNLCTPNFYLLN